MNQVPNWFRWLIIIVATLIMCACQAPLQQDVLQDTFAQTTLLHSSGDEIVRSVTPLAPPINPGRNVVAHEPLTLPKNAELRAAVISRQTSPAPSREQQIIDLLRSDLPEYDGAGFAPVVKQTTDGIRVQAINSPLPQMATGNAPVARVPLSVSQSSTSAKHAESQAIYVRIKDGAIETTAAQLDAEVGVGLGSPFGDDPIAPVPSELPPIPSIDVDPLQNQPVLDSVVHEPIIANDVAPPLGPSTELPIIYAPAPFEEYHPVEEVILDHSAGHPHAAENNFEQAELAKLYPDEYICDGGDANGGVFVLNDWSLRNLDPEDTIGHYDTKDHRVVVEPSNRVCIYAPRFAAARKVASAFQNETHLQVLLAERGTRAVVDEMQQTTNQYTRALAPKRQLVLQPASSLKVRQSGIEGIQRTAVKILEYELSAHEDFRVMKLGIHKQAEKPQLAEFTAKAATWTHDAAVQVLVDEAVVRTNVSRRGAETIFAIGDNGPAKLRVIKTASTEDALPGEEVQFTLRFDNTGYQTIGNVTIVDNLTTRLEFVDGSDLCSVDCEFSEDENAVESLTLRWEITDPIEPAQGGLIRFRCRVR